MQEKYGAADGNGTRGTLPEKRVPPPFGPSLMVPEARRGRALAAIASQARKRIFFNHAAPRNGMGPEHTAQAHSANRRRQLIPRHPHDALREVGTPRSRHGLRRAVRLVRAGHDVMGGATRPAAPEPRHPALSQ